MVEQLEVMLKSVRVVEELVHFKDYRKLTTMYLCNAEEEEEQSCKKFIAGQDGRCSYATVINQQKVCRAE